MLHILLVTACCMALPQPNPAGLPHGANPVRFQEEADQNEKQQELSSQLRAEAEVRGTDQKTRLSVDQIPETIADDKPADFQIKTQSSEAGNKASVGQLPGDLEIPEDDESQPELAISKPFESPEAALYSQVAEAWQMIRQRGQQPTPELVAREIGPDNLVRFLDQNPAAVDIFGQDSDALPVDQPGVEQLPDGGIVILPPSSG